MRAVFLLFFTIVMCFTGWSAVPVVGKITKPVDVLCAKGMLAMTEPAIKWTEDSLAAGWLLNGQRIAMPYEVAVGDDGGELVFWARSCEGIGYSDTMKLVVTQIPVLEELTVSPICKGMRLSPKVPVVANGVKILDTLWKLDNVIFDTTRILQATDNGKRLVCELYSCSGVAVSNGVRIEVRDAPTLVPMPFVGRLTVKESLSLEGADFHGETVIHSLWTLEGDSVSMPYEVRCEDRGKKLRYLAESRCGTSKDEMTMDGYSGFPAVSDSTSLVHANDTLKWKVDFEELDPHLNLWILGDDTITMPYKVDCHDHMKVLTFAGSCGCDTLNLKWTLQVEEYVTTTKDMRNSKEYSVKRMADGKWWMNEDLQYGTPVDADNYKESCKVSSQGLGNGLWGVCREDTVLNAGYYYNWQAAMQLTEVEYNNPAGIGNTPRQGICPDGWHLPSQQELIDLVASMGGNEDGTPISGSGGVSIINDFTDKDGICGGSIIQSGFIDVDGMRNPTNSAYLWSSTHQGGKAGSLLLSGNEVVFPTNTNVWSQGCTVRCVANEGFIPTIN